MDPPRLPRVKPHVAIVPVGAETVLLKGPALFVRYSGEAVPPLLRLVPLLDGTRTVDEAARAADITLEDARDLVEALAGDKVLEEAAHDAELRLPSEERARLAPQLQLLSHLTANPALAQNRLTDARVLVLGGGQTAAACAQALRAMGVGDVREGDERLSGEARLWSADALRAAFAGVDHVALATEAPLAAAFLAVNEAALSANVPFTGAFLDGLEASVGPTVIPWQTACWRCYDLRVKGAHPNMDRLMTYEAHAREAPAALSLPTFAPLAGHSLAQAVALALARVAPPPLAGRVQRHAFLDLRAETHRVLRVPRCPACTRANIPDVDRYNLEPVTLS